MPKPALISLLLRMGIASAFLYAAAASSIEPNNWVGYFPQFMRDLVPASRLLPVFSLYEIVLAGWLLSGKLVVYSATLSAATLVGIVGFNLGASDIVFRDIPIIFAAAALALLEKEV